MAARQLRRFSLLLLLLAFLPEGTLGAALAKAKPKKAKPKKKPAASSGGGFGAVAPKAAQASLLQPPQWKQAVQTKGAMLVAAPEDPQLWLEMGALLVKGREYAEAERVFRLGAITHPDFEYLSAAALTMGGDSEAYWHGQAVPLKPGPRVDAAAFDSFDAPAEVLDSWDQVRHLYLYLCLCLCSSACTCMRWQWHVQQCVCSGMCGALRSSACTHAVARWHVARWHVQRHVQRVACAVHAPEGPAAHAQADRAVEWTPRAKGVGVVHRSTEPLLSAEDCAWAIDTTEAHAAANPTPTPTPTPTLTLPLTLPLTRRTRRPTAAGRQRGTCRRPLPTCR